MKQEQTNTFSEGVNYDMTPMIMNSRVLSDCVNGTLVTFNGDELALQNDSGNATIKYNVGTSKNPIWESVSLSPGYYPIGIKEYGGVLYIVSACNQNSIEEWSAETNYYPSNIVKIKVGSGWTYYKCINSPDSKISPDLDSENWIQENNNLERIEIGSFPSPERPTLENKGNLPLPLNVYNDKQVLYKSTVINNGQFRAGNHITFSIKNPLLTDTSNISYYSFTNYISSTYHPKIYKVRLLQQLSNGFIDLTDNVWLQYANFKGYPLNSDSVSFWFNDSNFKYYCPNNYKGKLAILVELEDLESFKLTTSTINFSQGTYDFDFKLHTENKSELDIKWALLNSRIDEGGIITELDSILIPIVNNIAETTIQIQSSENNLNKRRLFYEITPVVCSTESNFMTNCTGVQKIDDYTFKNWFNISSNVTVENEAVTKSKLKFIWSSTSEAGLYRYWPIPNSDKMFTLSFKVKGPNNGQFKFGLEHDLKTINTCGLWQTITLQINSSGINLFDKLIFKNITSGTYELSDIKLELGDLSTEWCNSIESVNYKESDLPLDYLNKYIIKGSKLISSTNDDVLLERDKSMYRCYVDHDGTTFTTKYILKNNKNQYLTSQLDVSENTEYYFREYNPINLSMPSNCLGEFIINNEHLPKQATIKLKHFNSSLNISLKDYLQNLLETQKPTYSSEECNKVELTINLSKRLDSNGKVYIVQGESTIILTKKSDITYSGWISPNLNFTINVEYGIGNTFGHSQHTVPLGIPSTSTFNYAVICAFTVSRTYVDEFNYILYATSIFPKEMLLSSAFEFKHITSPDTDWAYGIISSEESSEFTGYKSEKLTQEPINLEHYTSILNFEDPAFEYSVPDKKYINISNNLEYRLVGNENEWFEIIKSE